jgi:hypothetical protein
MYSDVTHTFRASAGSTLRGRVQWATKNIKARQSGGKPVDLSGCYAEILVFDSWLTQLLFRGTASNGGAVIVDHKAGEIFICVPADITAIMVPGREYVYEVHIVMCNSDVCRILTGRIDVDPSIKINSMRASYGL